MNYIFFVSLCILGAEISTARKYLIIDLDALEKLELNSYGVRRRTENTVNVQQSNDFFKTVINTLQSYNEDQLRDALNSFKNELNDLDITDPTLNKAKEFLLVELSQIKDEPGKQIKDLVDGVSQILNDDSDDDVGPSMRAKEDNQVIGRLMAHLTLRSSKDEHFGNIIDSIKYVLQSVADFFLPSQKKYDLKGLKLSESKLLKNSEENGNKHNWKDLLSKLTNNPEENGNKHNWKDLVNELANNPEENGNKHNRIDLVRKLARNREKNENKYNWKNLVEKLGNNPEKNRNKHSWTDLISKLTNNPEENGNKHSWTDLVSKLAKNPEENFNKHHLKDLVSKVAKNPEENGNKHHWRNLASKLAKNREQRENNWKDLPSKLAYQLQKITEDGGKTDWKKHMLSKLSKQPNNPEAKNKWKKTLKKFIKDTEGKDWMNILKKFSENQEALDFLENFAKSYKVEGHHYHGVHLSF